jgi:hypothetical protein
MDRKLKTRQEIALEYGINRKTLYRKLKAKGILIPGKHLLSLSEQQAIYQAFGDPPAPCSNPCTHVKADKS